MYPLGRGWDSETGFGWSAGSPERPALEDLNTNGAGRAVPTSLKRWGKPMGWSTSNGSLLQSNPATVKRYLFHQRTPPSAMILSRPSAKTSRFVELNSLKHPNPAHIHLNQLYQNHLERLGLKDFRVLQYTTLSRRRIILRIVPRIPLVAILGLLALPGLTLWLPVFVTVTYFTKKHKQTGPVWDTYDEISQTKLIYGLMAGTTTWLIACLVTIPFSLVTAAVVPVIMWMALRWTEDLVASVRSIVALSKLLLVGKSEMNKTLLWRENLHTRVMQLATERLNLPANSEEFFLTKTSPGPRWDTKGGADKGRTQGLWARGTKYFSLRRRRKRDWNETMRWYDQTYFPEDES